MLFKRKLQEALIENFTQPQSGHETFMAYIPEELDPNETDVEVEYDWQSAEPRTRDYPGSQGGLWITAIRSQDGRELDIDTIPPELMQHFTELANDHLASHYQSREDYEADRADRMRDERKDMMY